jgi:hypothetical protein
MPTRRDFTKYIFTVPLWGISRNSEKRRHERGIFYMIYNTHLAQSPILEEYPKPDVNDKICEIFHKNRVSETNFYHGRYLTTNELNTLDFHVARNKRGIYVRIHYFDKYLKTYPNSSPVKPPEIHDDVIKLYHDVRKHVKNVGICVWSLEHIDEILKS